MLYRILIYSWDSFGYVIDFRNWNEDTKRYRLRLIYIVITKFDETRRQREIDCCYVIVPQRGAPCHPLSISQTFPKLLVINLTYIFVFSSLQNNNNIYIYTHFFYQFLNYFSRKVINASIISSNFDLTLCCTILCYTLYIEILQFEYSKCIF